MGTSASPLGPSPWSWSDEGTTAPHPLHWRQFSKFGSDHPTDIALGISEHMGHLANIAKGGSPSSSDRMANVQQLHENMQSHIIQGRQNRMEQHQQSLGGIYG